MYLLRLLVFPLLYLVNPYLAMAGLVSAIAGMYFQRTQRSGRQAGSLAKTPDTKPAMKIDAEPRTDHPAREPIMTASP